MAAQGARQVRVVSVLAAILAVLSILSLGRAVRAAESVSFDSVTPRNVEAFLDGLPKLPPMRLSAVLHLPPGARAPVPAVIIAHGSGGVSESREGAWAARVVSWGYAALVVDSFAPRGIRETATDQSQLSTFANVADGFAALAWLAKDPRIDARRIAVMGFSKGAVVALHAATEPLRAAAGVGDSRFAAHVALYPGCDVRYWSARQSTSPILMLLAGDDDYTPPEPCRAHAEDLRRAGAKVTLESYQGARHGFDRPVAVRFVPQVETVRGCAAVFDMDRRHWSMAQGGAEVSGRELGDYFRRCRSRGAHIGGQEAALEGAISAIRAHLARAFE